MSHLYFYLSLYIWVAALILLLRPANREDAFSALLWPWSALVYGVGAVVLLGLLCVGLALVLAGLTARVWDRLRRMVCE